MSLSVYSAAQRLAEKSGWSLSNLEIQKLLYLAHMFHMGEHEEPLVNEHFEAWDYGPVQPDLYHKLKIYGSSPVKHIFTRTKPFDEGSETEIIDKTVDQLSHRAAGWLVAATHWDKGAWAKYYEPGTKGIIIPNSEIQQEYRDRVDALRRRQATI